MFETLPQTPRCDFQAGAKESLQPATPLFCQGSCFQLMGYTMLVHKLASVHGGQGGAKERGTLL